MTADEIHMRIEERLLDEGLGTARASRAASDSLVAIQRTIPEWQSLKWPALERRMREVGLYKAVHGANGETSTGMWTLAVLANDWETPNREKAQAKGAKERSRLAGEERDLLREGASWLLWKKPDLGDKGRKMALITALLHDIEHLDANGRWSRIPARSPDELRRVLTHLRGSDVSEGRFRFLSK